MNLGVGVYSFITFGHYAMGALDYFITDFADSSSVNHVDYF